MMREKNVKKDQKCSQTEIYTQEDINLIVPKDMDNTIGKMVQTTGVNFYQECVTEEESGK